MTPRSPFKFGVCGKYRETEKFWDSQDQGRGVSVLSLEYLGVSLGDNHLDIID